MNIHDEMSIVLDALTKLNRKSKKEILTQEEIKEQEENLLDFEKKMNKIEEVINQLRSTDSRDVHSVTDLLMNCIFYLRNTSGKSMKFIPWLRKCFITKITINLMNDD